MTVVPTEIGVLRDTRGGAHDAPADGRLTPRASVYFWGVTIAALALAIPLVARIRPDTSDWITFALLAALAAVVQLFIVRTPRNQAYYTTIVFLVPAAMLLPPELAVLVPFVQHIPEWLKTRIAWYIQVFNIANYTLATLAACACATVIRDSTGLIARPDARFALAGLAAAGAFVLVNHVLLAPMINLARGHSIRETGLFSFDALSTDFVLACLGVAIAALWTVSPWIVPFAIAPLFLIHRSLAVPQLQAEARIDPKTGLFNARHFAATLEQEVGRAKRFNRPLSVVMADLDLLRDINNTYGHLAGDAVLKGISEIFRTHLRHYDVPSRFGGEEFGIVLPETPPEQALEIAERIRRAVAAKDFDVETSSEPVRVTISLGVACFPKDGEDANTLIHQADLAVYRAKLQGRNRVTGASTEPLVMPADRSSRLAAVPFDEPVAAVTVPLAPAAAVETAPERRQPRHHPARKPHFLKLSIPLAALVAIVAGVGAAAGVVALLLGRTDDAVGLVVVALLVAVGQALALEVDDGSISVAAVGALAGVAMFGPRAALPLAVVTVAVEWSARRDPIHQVLFNIGSLSLASLAAAAVFAGEVRTGLGDPAFVVAGLVAGIAYFAVNTGLVSLALALESGESWFAAWRERFLWLLPHYVVYGFIGAVIAIAYHAAGLYILVVFAVPVFLMRKTQESYLAHARRTAQKLRAAAETIHVQNVSLEQANRLLKERSTAAMESLSATVDARDSYTAGHSRRVQELSLAIGREVGLSPAELDLLGHAALFHDIGKLAIPDEILLKPSRLTESEWELMRGHADEGARIIDRLGFLHDAVPAIRHHHERYDGTGYPHRLAGDEIPLGARIIHVADALDSMLTTRIYRAARPAGDALDELRVGSGSQFCPRCVAALERIAARGGIDLGQAASEADRLVAAS